MSEVGFVIYLCFEHVTLIAWFLTLTRVMSSLIYLSCKNKGGDRNGALSKGGTDLFTLQCVLPLIYPQIFHSPLYFLCRHAIVSLEMLLKLVAVFGTVVRSAVSAPRAVGVDLHAEER